MQVLFEHAPLESFSHQELVEALAGVPQRAMSQAELRTMPVLEAVIACGACSSKGACHWQSLWLTHLTPPGKARRLLADGGLYLNNKRVTQDEASRPIGSQHLAKGLCVFRVGRRKQYVLHVA